MFAQAHFPHALDEAQLDRYLENGWFRMGQTIFTTNFLNFNDRLYSALWLRIDLKRFTFSRKQQQLKKTNARFTEIVRPASLDPLKELLYARYKSNISFEASPSLHQLLFGSAVHNVYRTLEFNILDGEKLIACGFFDIGKKTAAGISSFYDPDYKKFSLGKHLICKKIEYCQERGMDFFYPGYFVSGYRLFDYKLEIGGKALEYLDVVTKKWLPIENFSASNTPILQMEERLASLQKLLTLAGIRNELLKYEFFDANILIDSEKAGLFDFPIFIYCPDIIDAMMIPIVYDVRDKQFHIIRCGSLWSNDIHPAHPGTYSSYLLRVVQELHKSDKETEIVAMLSHYLKSHH